jgi:hypothetical protein
MQNKHVSLLYAVWTLLVHFHPSPLMKMIRSWVLITYLSYKHGPINGLSIHQVLAHISMLQASCNQIIW